MHCAKCGTRFASTMVTCPLTHYEVGEHRLPERLRFAGRDLIVEPAPLFAALARAYEAMWIARAKKLAA